jgi:hypothetical protein
MTPSAATAREWNRRTSAGVNSPPADANLAYLTPEAKARVEVDRMLAGAGWIVQDYKRVNLSAARGVAVRETFRLTALPKVDRSYSVSR